MDNLDHILIQRFVEGTLTGTELKDFQEKMTANETFRNEVEFHYLLFSGIRHAREQELINYVTSNVALKSYTPRSVIAIVIVMLIIIVSGVGVWNYLEKDVAVTNKHFFTFDFFSKEKNKNGDKPKERRSFIKENKQVVAPDTLLQAKQDSTNAVHSENTSDSLTADANIVIKKDELVTVLEVPVLNKSAEKSKESLAKETAEKLNPAAQLPEPDSHPVALQVEFWQSPVNYKGFKLAKNKLVLFGIDRPDAVKLYSLNDQLYMQYDKMITKLSPAEDYQSFLAIRESEIPTQLK